jgi:phosphopantothenoylcysteine synthetase/decarboxylase
MALSNAAEMHFQTELLILMRSKKYQEMSIEEQAEMVEELVKNSELFTEYESAVFEQTSIDMIHHNDYFDDDDDDDDWSDDDDDYPEDYKDYEETMEDAILDIQIAFDALESNNFVLPEEREKVKKAITMALALC